MPCPLEVPSALLAWRRLGGTHVIILGSDGRVTLRRGSVLADDAEEAAFPNVATAAEAVGSLVPWRRVARSESDGPPVSRRRGRLPQP